MAFEDILSLTDYIRKYYGGSQSEFARNVGVARNQVYLWVKKGFYVIDHVMYSPRRPLPMPPTAVQEGDEPLYYILSVSHTQRENPYIMLWGPENSGYRGRIGSAGRYTAAQVNATPLYYNNGTETIAVLCRVADKLAVPVRPGFFDTDEGKWLRNTRATWQALEEAVIAPPRHPIQPDYPGAPKRKDEY